MVAIFKFQSLPFRKKETFLEVIVSVYMAFNSKNSMLIQSLNLSSVAEAAINGTYGFLNMHTCLEPNKFIVGHICVRL